MNLPDGIHYGVPAEEYHADHSRASVGALKLLRDAPAALEADWNRAEDPSPAMVLGSAVHCALLEPERFTSLYVRLSASRVSKTGKGEAEIAAASKQIALTASEYDKAIAMRDAARRWQPDAAALLDAGDTEVTILWHEQTYTGEQVPCKARVDILTMHEDKRAMVTDLKTTKEADRESFQRRVSDGLYHWQEAHYRAGLRTMGVEVVRWLWWVESSVPPHLSGLYELDPASVMIGESDRQRYLAVWAECMRSGKWPGYPREVQLITLPRWAR